MISKIFKSKKFKRILTVILIPIAIVAQYYLFKDGILSPMVKGIDIQIIGGNYIKSIDKYVVKEGDTVTVYAGDYIIVPGYAKRPSIWFNVLDDSGVIKVEGNKLTGLRSGLSSIGVMKKNRVLKKASIMVVNPVIVGLDVDFNGKLKSYGDSAIVKGSVKASEYKQLEKGKKPVYESSNPKILKVEGNRVTAIGVGKAKVIAKYGKKVVEATFEIGPRVDKIDVAKEITLEVEQTVPVNAKFAAMPKGAKPPKAHYKYYGAKRDSERIFTVDDKGNITGRKIGTDILKVECGGISADVVVKVKKQSVPNIKIRNIRAVKINSETLRLTWKKAEGINTYFIYRKTADDDDFVHISTVNAGNTRVDDKGYMGEIQYIPSDSKVEFYVVGYSQGEFTRKSEIVH